MLFNFLAFLRPCAAASSVYFFFGEMWLAAFICLLFCLVSAFTTSRSTPTPDRTSTSLQVLTCLIYAGGILLWYGWRLSRWCEKSFPQRDDASLIMVMITACILLCGTLLFSNTDTRRWIRAHNPFWLGQALLGLVGFWIAWHISPEAIAWLIVGVCVVLLIHAEEIRRLFKMSPYG